ncbi:uncharacterized protein LOC114453878 isoform X2 [Parambassis ranga]|uniref:Uncharacterized protein LOC114428102 isoform X2 n=1 Tax=Parambassis ranga TaxID=210632 RepID=A0A6P7KJ93_9TELE|nr:uncharacterized protein LOC114428102 isoform X2 [Parambassis ranga]XP_028273857.1 uncharacterized protein LOC114443756 isoform X2 [Parambassis ranga]XP_028289614.1 uncharacterized protein LOC114453878 isoform X2 [Parambassis ranga]
MLVQVKYCEEKKYVKLNEVEGHFNFGQFSEKVIERFCLPPDVQLTFKDATGTEVDAEIFSDLLGQGNVVLTVFSNDEFSDCSRSSASDLSFSSSGSTIIMDEVPRKKLRIEDLRSMSAKQLIEDVLRSKSGGEEVLQEYQTTETLTDATRRQMVNILVAHMIDNHGHLPTKAVREDYAKGIVMLFPSLRDPYSNKGYEHFYDAASNTGYISWRLKRVQRKIRRGYAMSPNTSTDISPRGPNFQRTVNVERQLDGSACQEAISLLNHTTDKSLIFQKMRETFHYRQKLVNDPGRSDNILSTFPRFLDTKGLVDQDFTLLFDEETSARLLQKWDVFFKPNVIKEAKQLTSTPELRRLVQSAESPIGRDFDEATRGPKSPKISACDAAERLVVFHKSCCSLEEHFRNQQSRQPYLLAVGRQKNQIDNFYITMDKHLIPCQANRSLGACDELFKAHFVFNLSYDVALVNFYTFLQTTVYNIDVGKMKESPRVRDMRARLLNQTVELSLSE